MITRLVLTMAFLLALPSTASNFLVPAGVGPALLAAPAADKQGNSISASEYFPVKPNVFCRRTYTSTYGPSQTRTSEIVGSLTVPYTTQPLTGALFCGYAGAGGISAWDSGGLRNIFEGDHYVSADCEMTSFPEMTLPDSIYDGMLFSFGSVQGVQVKKDLDGCGISGDADETLLFRIQDVSVGGKTFRTAVVMWFLQDGEAFVPLDFHGKEFDLGLRLPDASATGDRRVLDFFVLGRHEGVIAGGPVDDAGSLTTLYELTSVDCSARIRWDVFDVPKYWSTYARAINNDGDVVGYAEKRDGSASSFLRRDGAVTVFTPSALGADHSWAMGINNLGDIVGHFTVGWDWHGYLLHDGVYTQIDMPGELAALPYGINDRGDIVGTTYLGLNRPDHGFLLRDGAFTEIKVPGSNWTQALSLNNNGDIVGNFGDASGIHGFLLSAGVYTTLDYPGAVQTQATGINDDGEFVGRFRQTAGGPLVAFARVKGEFLPVSGPCDIRVSGATDINEKGEIAGFFLDEEEGIRWAFVVSAVKKGD